MRGKHDIVVYNKRVHYFLSVRRNFTILQGDSATGKSELIRLVSQWELRGASSGITLICDVGCTVLNSLDWEHRLSRLQGSIVFIDENESFVQSHRFAEIACGSDNYFIIINRDNLPQLPYSINEIYGLRNVSDSQKYRDYRRVYNETYCLYSLSIDGAITPEMVITEDSNSGFDFFVIATGGKCISSHGKSRVLDTVRQYEGSNQELLVVVDGAAFGPEVQDVMRYIETHQIVCTLYAPESFEYLVLRSGLLDVPKGVWEETFLYADSKSYVSWEAFYTSYLCDITRNTVFQYGKSRLADAYRTSGAVGRIVGTMPVEVVDACMRLSGPATSQS